mgnify:CR=1 FL=1
MPNRRPKLSPPPPDADTRRAVAPVVCYPPETLPEAMRAQIEQLHAATGPVERYGGEPRVPLAVRIRVDVKRSPARGSGQQPLRLRVGPYAEPVNQSCEQVDGGVDPIQAK